MIVIIRHCEKGVAYPNPFNSAVRISVETLHATSLRIEIFDINGRMVAELSPRNCICNFDPLIKGVSENDNSPLNRGDVPKGQGGFLRGNPTNPSAPAFISCVQQHRNRRLRLSARNGWCI
jgi:hypothetical protein